MADIESKIIDFLQRNKGECFHIQKLSKEVGMNFGPGDLSSVLGFTLTVQRMAREGKIQEVLESGGEKCWKAK